MLTFENVFYRYGEQSHFALDGCNVVLPQGQRIALMGCNGSGKSTFFLHCNGILQPRQGRVLLEGQPLRYDRATLKKVRQQIGIVFQSAEDQLFSANIAQDIRSC